MRSFDTVVSLVASVVVLIAVALVGTYLAPSPTLPSSGPTHDSAVCDHEPLVPGAATATTGLGQLCVNEGGFRTWMELVGLQSDAFYTGWIAYGSRPFSSRGFPCGESGEGPSVPRHVPVRIGGALADHDGRIRFLTSYQGIHLTDGDDVWILVIGHGVVPPDDRRTLAWEPGWWSAASVTDRDAFTIGRLIGCGHFQRRGGVESLEPLE
jgi:hypothetical protein